MRLLLICLGGALGTAARYGLSTWCRSTLGAGFPYGTLAVNVIGSYLLSMIMYIGMNTELISPATRVVLGVGVMGGFTTYSSFNYETVQLLEERTFLLAGANLLATVLGCMTAGFLGLATARWAVNR